MNPRANHWIAPPVRAALLGTTLLGAPAAAAAVDAGALLAAGKYREAADAARARLDAAGAGGHLWHILGDAQTATGDTALALTSYERALVDDPEHRLQIQVAMARGERLRGRGADAERRLRAVAARHETDAAGLSASELTAAADAERLLGEQDPARYRRALRLYELAIARAPQSLFPRVALADLLLEKYNNTEALALYREVLEMDPDHVPAVLGLARSHYFDHSRTAMDVVRRALDLQPSLVPARVLLARMLVELEDYAGAEQELERALAVNPNSPAALTMQLTIRYLKSDRPGFEDLLARLRALAPGYHELYATLAEIAAQNRLYADAVGFARAGVARRPTFWRAHGLLGLNHLRLGRMEAGRRSLENAFRGDPFNVQIKNTLDLLDRIGEFTTLRRGRFILAADPRDAALLAPHLFPLAEAAYAHFEERYGHAPGTPIRIEVYPRHEDFSVRTVGLVGVGILGVSFGPTVAFDSPSARAFGPVNWGSVLWHELAHTFHLSLSGSRVPRWFTEGLAVVEERRARPGWGADVDPGFLEAYQQGRLPTASGLNAGFIRPSYPEQLGHVYLQASLLLEFIEERHGMEVIRAMLRGYREGLPTASILAAGLGLTAEALDREFDVYMNTRFAGALAALADPSSAPGDATAPHTGAGFRAQWRAGREALERGDLDAAETALTAAKESFPEFAAAGSPYDLLARVHRQRGNIAAAIAELTVVVATDADDLDVHRRLAEAHLANQDPGSAARVLERALFIDPFDGDVRERLAAIHETAGAWTRAVPHRRALAALEPMDPAAAHFRLAKALAGSADHDAARREVLRALEIAPMYDEALELLLEVRAALVEDELEAPGE